MPTITITLEPSVGDAIREMAWLDIATALEEIGDVGTSSSIENLLGALPEARAKLDQVEQKVAPFGVSDGEPHKITVDRDRLCELATQALDDCHEEVRSAISEWEADGGGTERVERAGKRPAALIKLLESLDYEPHDRGING